MRRIIFFSLILIIYAILLSVEISVYAQELKSSDYKIESGALILQPELSQDAATYDVPASFGLEAQKKFEEAGYVVVGSNEVDSSENSFIRLKLDKSQLVFDSAEASGESTQQSSINVLGVGSTNFMVSIRQSDEFKNGFGAKVNATSCDNQFDKCSPTLAKAWKKVSGFGYRASGGTMRDFNNKYAYRPMFVGGSTGHSAVLLNKELEKSGIKMDLQFKLRPSSDVQTGIYKGTVIITTSADY